jgi:hypothetical protein
MTEKNLEMAKEKEFSKKKQHPTDAKLKLIYL